MAGKGIHKGQTNIDHAFCLDKAGDVFDALYAHFGEEVKADYIRINGLFHIIVRAIKETAYHHQPDCAGKNWDNFEQKKDGVR